MKHPRPWPSALWASCLLAAMSSASRAGLPGADLAIRLDTENTTVGEGDLVEVLVDITNLTDQGTPTADDTDYVVVYTDSRNAELVTYPPECRLESANNLQCSFGVLGPSESRQFSVRLRFQRQGTLRLLAVVRAFDEDGLVQIDERYSNNVQDLRFQVVEPEPDEPANTVFSGNGRERALLLAGNFPGDTMFEPVHLGIFWAKEGLQAHGLDNESILHLANDPAGAEQAGLLVDGKATLANLRGSIGAWLQSGAEPARKLLIYLVGHGAEDFFRMGSGQTLRGDEFATLLDEFEPLLPEGIVIVYDACESGGFSASLASTSTIPRLIVTSSSSNQPAYFQSGGVGSFSYPFWTEFYKSGDLRGSFLAAKRSVLNRQSPSIEADGDGVGGGKEDDRRLRDFSFGNESRKPLETTPLTRLGTQSIFVRPANESIAERVELDGETQHAFSRELVLDTTFFDETPRTVAEVWGSVARPLPYFASTTFPVTRSDRFDFTPVAGTDTWEGTYSGFDEQGEYAVQIFARSSDGIVTEIGEPGFFNQEVGLPGEVAPDFDSDGLADALDPDDDNDGVNDDLDDLPFNPFESVDTDGDSIGDDEDLDDDGDGIPDDEDPMPLDFQRQNHAPVIALNGDAVVILMADEPFVDEGVTVTDAEDGNLNHLLQSTGEVDTSTSGLYEILYSAVDSEGLMGSAARQVVVLGSPPGTVSSLSNISTRGIVGSADEVLIGGFIVAGTEPKTVTIRARGPSLDQFGVPNTLDDPDMSLFDAGGNQIDQNDNWADHPNVGLMPPALAPDEPTEAAITRQLDPGAYTAIVRGAGGATGVGIVEVFDVD